MLHRACGRRSALCSTHCTAVGLPTESRHAWQAREAPASYFTGGPPTVRSKCCWCIPADRSGPERTLTPGRFPRASTARARMPRWWPCGSSRRSWDRHRPPGRGYFSASSVSPAASGSAHGHSRRTSTRRAWSAIPSSSSGLPAPVRSRSSRKWTRRPGGRSMRPGRSCTRARPRYWTPWPRPSMTTAWRLATR